MLAAGYRNVGTVEFLYQPEERALAFLEVNTRLQVEHPVTEAMTGLDLVKLQIHIAAGGRLEGEPPSARGHAIEARVNAEDAERGFAPAPGTVELLGLPTGPGIRVDTGISEGDVIPSQYDSMIAKVIACGSDRAEALARLRRALEEMRVVVRGGATNRAFLIDLLGRPEVVAGTADTGWLDRLAAEGGLISDRGADVALIAAAIDSDEAEEAVERRGFYASARRGRPKASHEISRKVELRHRGRAYHLTVARTGPGRYRVAVPEGVLEVDVDRRGPFESRLRVNGHTHRVISVVHPPDHLIEVDGVAHRVSRDEGGLVRAPAPALVVSVTVVAGDAVTAGTPVAVLESMKMETTVTAPFDGVVAEVLVAGNVQVDAGAPLLRMEARIEGAVSESGRPRIVFDIPATASDDDPRRRASEILGAIRSLLLGYDVSAAEARRLVAELDALRKALPPDDPALLQGEIDALGVFADLAELSRARPPMQESELAEEMVHSPREHFHHYLRSLDAEREGVPESLRRSLERALGHYGVEGLDPSAGPCPGRLPHVPRRGAGALAVAGRGRPARRPASRRRHAARPAAQGAARDARPPRGRHPAPPPRDRGAGTQRPLRLLRPPADRGGPRTRLPSRAGPARAPGREPRRPRPRAAHRRGGRHLAAAPADPRGARPTRPRRPASRCSRC